MPPTRPRPGADAKASSASVTARRVFAGVAVVALALLVWRLADVFLLLFGGIIAAAALRALAAPFERYLHLSPRLALAAGVVLALVVLAGGGWLAGDRLAEQLGNLRERLPEAQAALTRWLNDTPLGRWVQGIWEATTDGAVPWAHVASMATLTLGALGSVLLVAIIGIYLAADPGQYRRGLLRVVSPEYRNDLDAALAASGHALSRWLLGQGISMLFVGTSTAIGLAMLGVPLALSLGVIGGLLAFVPFFGPILSGLLAVLIGFLEGPTQALYVALLCVAIQQIEGSVLMPLVQRWAVALPPVLGIAAGVAFGVLFGIVGLILATPLMVVTMVLVRKLYVEDFLERDGKGARPGGES